MSGSASGSARGERRALVVESGAAPHVLAAARALGAAGWAVGVAVSGTPGPRSRHVDEVHRVPRPEDAPEDFLAGVAQVVRAGRYQVVFGADDIEVLALSAGRASIPCVVPYAAHDDVERAIDKLELSRAAATVGLGTPTTEPATDTALDALAGPVVVKSRLHWTPGTSTGERYGLAALCPTPHEARERVRALRALGVVPLLQEPVDGELMALTTVVDREGVPVGFCQQRTTRRTARGTSCRAETVPVDDGLAAGVVDLLRELRWFGLANVQFLRRPGGPPLVIDLNGRFYGSLALCVAAGLNLPDAWGRLALGEPVPALGRARAGVRFSSLLEDLRRARDERRGGVVADVAASLAAAVGATHVHADWGDPRPAADLLRRMVARRLPARRGTDP